jgi:hypothetical protein
VSMTEFTLHLPPKKASIDRLGRLDADSRQQLTDDLLHAIWESEEAGELPASISHVVRGWVAHARFAQDPVIAERRARVRKQG